MNFLKRIIVGCISCILLLLLVGCKVKTESIQFEKKSFDIDVGDTISLGYEILPEDASNQEVTIKISDETFLRDNGDDTYTGLKEGYVTISLLQDNEVYDVCDVTVHRVPVEAVCFELPSLTLGVGRTNSPAVSILPYNATNKDYSLSTNQEDILKINPDGVTVTALAEGETLLTVMAADGATSEIPVYVVPVDPDGITITMEESNFLVGDSAQLALVWDPKDVTYQDVTWRSSNKKILSVSEEGIVTGNSLGTATITATHSTGVSASYDIEVLPVPVASVSINSEGESTVYQGSTVSLSVDIFPTNATDKTVIWTSSNTNVATVSATGRVSAVGVGSAVISATASNGVKDNFTVNVKSTTRQMTVRVSATCDSYNSVGNEWVKYFSVNGAETIGSDIVSVKMNSSISVYTEIIESDSIPDVGTGRYSCKVSQDYFENGFYITQTIPVRENRGRYSGNIATWTVVYDFSV